LPCNPTKVNELALNVAKETPSPRARKKGFLGANGP